MRQFKPMIFGHRLFIFAGLGLLITSAVVPRRVLAEAPVADPIATRASKVRQEIQLKLGQMLKNEVKPQTVETYCLGWQPEELFRRFPLIRAELKLCAGRAAFHQGKVKQANSRFQEAHEIAFQTHPELPESLQLQMEARFRRALISKERMFSQTSCVGTLGLEKLHQFQSRHLLARLKETEKTFVGLVKANVQPWAAAAAVEVAKIQQSFLAQFFLSPKGTFRGVQLPEPFEVMNAARFRLGEELYPSYPLILSEVDRLIAELERRAEMGEYRDTLRNLKAEQVRLKAGMRQTVSKVKNPFFDTETLREGTLSWQNKRLVRKTLTGSWRPMEKQEENQFLNAIWEKGPEATPEFLLAWSGAAAKGNRKVDPDWLSWALEHPSPFVRFTGLYVLQLQPNADFLSKLLEIFKEEREKSGSSFSERFGTINASLYGLEERALLALKALVKYQRQTSIKLFYNDKSLPHAERAWVLAELGDPNLIYRYQDMVAQPEKEVAAIGLYASYFTSGGKSTWLLNTSSRHKEDLVRCVALSLLAFDAEKRTKQENP